MLRTKARNNGDFHVRDKRDKESLSWMLDLPEEERKKEAWVGLGWFGLVWLCKTYT